MTALHNITNNLVALTLWHKLIALTPPRGLIEDIQSAILDFFGLQNTGSMQLAFIYLWLKGDRD